MKSITLNSRKYQSKGQETVLETLLRHGVDIPYSCKAGICKTCTMHLLDGVLNRESKVSLGSLKHMTSTFLPCVCRPATDIVVSTKEGNKKFKGIVIAKELISKDIVKLQIKPQADLTYQGGQFINLTSPEGLIRSYSIASIFKNFDDNQLELHVKRVNAGEMTGWIFDEMTVGQEVSLEGPFGGCHYQFNEHRKLLLIGNGTGLAPLMGILKDALRYQHKAEIMLYHSAKEKDGLYLVSDLKLLEEHNDNLSCHFSISSPSTDSELPIGGADEFAFNTVKELEGWDIFICGSPDMVQRAYSQAINANVEPEHIYVDVFESIVRNDFEELANSHDEGDTYPEPDPEIWQELQEGKLLKKILEEFYDEVYEDSILAPFFEGVSKRHVISKQYSFLYKAFTGEDIYLGDRPRNAHHWMVITDDIFDHREALFEKALIQNNVSEATRKKWLDMHESYRRYMVKDKPWARIMQGVVQPVSGFSRIKLEMDYLCDSCSSELSAGSNVLYNLEGGQLYCPDCSNSGSSN